MINQQVSFPKLDNLLKPKKLNLGDTIATVSLSAGLAELFPKRYATGVKQLEEVLGLKVVPTKHALKSNQWIYENPQARADDWMEALLDPNIKAIFSIIGGDDSLRLLPYMDLNVIKNNPKLFLGFSDTTVSHFINLKAGVSSIYGPSIMTSFAENCGMHSYTSQALKQCLFSNAAIGTLPVNQAGWTVEHLDWSVEENQTRARQLLACDGPRYINGSKISSGRLIGGCLEVLTMICATEIWPDLSTWKDSILFIETSEDGIAPIAVTWFLRNLAAQNILQNLSGILFSKPGGSKIDPKTFPDYDQAILAVLKEYNISDLNVVTNLNFGHTEPFFPLAYGALAEINPEEKTINLPESFVA